MNISVQTAPSLPPAPLPPLLSGPKGSEQSPAGDESLLLWGSGWSEGITITSGDLIASWHYEVSSPGFRVPAWASPAPQVKTFPWGL